MQAIYSAASPSPMRRPPHPPSPLPKRHISSSQPHHHGCTNSPSSSPQPSVKGYSRPVMPGYFATASHQPATARGSLTVQQQQQHHTGSSAETNLRDSIPAMSRPVAIACLICNILSPGLGTFISGLTALCCSRPRPEGTAKLQVVWINTWVAVLQCCTTFLLLLGWIWSIIWGIAFISISNEYYYASTDDETGKDSGEKKELQNGETRNIPEATLSPSVTSPARDATAQPSLTVPAADRSRSDGVPRSQTAPIIVLQEAPIIVQPVDKTNTRTIPNFNPNSVRHQRLLRGQSAEQISNYLISPERLEGIVIHGNATMT
ncbi:protein SPEC3 isoform X1 [Lingula anatina]|uniref:Protein SPEC3 isoform X1 n=1 Tax=Lingula anatina TaxID=7574 RepID=A0A1S3HXZ2_LINAN|nr:protein SPEC3 isoform X1 [Lingula anatina]|eukprot:XP_013390431.1 protein SPEC3 isoform X1 [Lingula anatina]